MKINQETKKNILTITYAGVVLFVILYFSKVIGFLASIWQLLVPFIIGFAIAFVLNIIIHQLENTLYKNIKKNKRILSFITMFLLIVLFYWSYLFYCRSRTYSFYQNDYETSSYSL